LRISVDAIAEVVDQDFIEGAHQLKNNQAEKYKVTLPQ
jgi:hypothetical protein